MIMQMPEGMKKDNSDRDSSGEFNKSIKFLYYLFRDIQETL